MLIRIQKILKIRPGEERLVAAMVGIMLSAAMGGAIGSPGIEGLFFTRFGVEFLPPLYIGLGVVTVITSLIFTAVLGRVQRRALYVWLPFIMAVLLLVARILIAFDLSWFYPVLWLGMNILWTLQGLFSWGIAGLVSDTRQAKRLFPLFGAGGILGISIGGIVTQPLVGLLQAQNLILIWAAGLGLSFLFGYRLLYEEKKSRPSPISGRRQSGVLEDILAGYRFVSGSELMRWLALAAMLFGVLFFSLSFPFSKAVAVRFPDENELSGFLGIFQGITTGLAFLASIFLANKLYARFGITYMVLVYTGIYLTGFLALAAYETFLSLVIFRFFQVFWYQGIASSAYQAIFNAVPPDKRDQARTFIDGVPTQIGVTLAGVMLLVSNRFLTSQFVFFLGGILAAFTTYFAWRASHAYRGALVAALRAGQPQLFPGEETPFGGFQRDATAVMTVVDGISHPDPVVRRVSAEILGNLAVPEAIDAMVAALDDEDTQVRMALVKSLARARAAPALLEIITYLHDPEPEVRQAVIEALRTLAIYSRGVVTQVTPLLEDVDPGVRANAAVTLLQYENNENAEAVLETLVSAEEISSRILAFEAIALSPHIRIFPLTAAGLEDSNPAVRRAAAEALAEMDPDHCLEPLLTTLADDDSSVRQAVAEAIGRIGKPALKPVLTALMEPDYEAGALMALAHLRVGINQAMVIEFINNGISQALYYQDLSIRCVAPPTDSRAQLLQVSLTRKARTYGSRVLQAIALLRNTDSIHTALENLESPNTSQRANALEILETIDDADLVRPLQPLWDQGLQFFPSKDGCLSTILRDPDPWLRACAVLAAGVKIDPELKEYVVHLSENDSDELVRETAIHTLKGDHAMETLATLSTMERILFLRQVPLFSDLPPADLKRVASVARESLYKDGETIVTQGELGDEMYIIVSGEVVVGVGAEDSSLLEVARRHSGEYVGEMAIISHEPRMASLTASGDVRTLSIGRLEFEGILRERPETSLAVMRVLCLRLRELKASV